MNDGFRRFAAAASRVSGKAGVFALALAVVLVWLVTGPLFGYSNTWQLVINTGTTIITFLMVFLLQNTQNRDNQAVHLKLDELLRAVKNARTSFIDIEELPDEDLELMAEQFHKLQERAQKERESRAKRKPDSKS